MKFLFLLLAFTYCIEGDVDCSAFYKETLVPISFDGILIKKEKTDQYYILYVRDKKDNKTVTKVQLLNNRAGKMIYQFATDSSIVAKRKNQLNLHIAAPMVNGYNVRIFKDFCE